MIPRARPVPLGDRVRDGATAGEEMKIETGLLPGPVGDESPVEMVERKGLGHPDTVCDALAEELSLALCRLYRERFGALLHHNVDKVLLRGGQSRPAYGGGEVTAPIEIYLAGRATMDYRGVALPVEELAIETSRAWIKRHLRFLDPERHVSIHVLLRPGSAELVELFLRQQRTGAVLANDTSCGVGYAPLSRLERLGLGLEAALNSPAAKRVAPEIGEDIKVMAVRRREEVRVTLACALIDRFVAGLEDYVEKKARLAARARDAARACAGGEAEVAVNTADDPTAGSVYLTVTGTSAEAGDDGEAGRGNRANGLITPYRPMTMESLAGKNPVSHVGKLYNLLAGLVAAEIVAAVPGVSAAECYLVSRIGRPIDAPELVHLRLQLVDRAALGQCTPRAEEIARAELSRAGQLWEELLSGRLGFGRWPLRAG